jgi:hypothetical protein
VWLARIVVVCAKDHGKLAKSEYIKIRARDSTIATIMNIVVIGGILRLLAYLFVIPILSYLFPLASL